MRVRFGPILSLSSRSVERNVPSVNIIYHKIIMEKNTVERPLIANEDSSQKKKRATDFNIWPWLDCIVDVPNKV